jgi:hypothetical protein
MRVTNAHYDESFKEMIEARIAAQLGVESRYNGLMIIAIWAMRLLVAMFFIGLVGSSVVVLISFVEDGKELFGKD